MRRRLTAAAGLLMLTAAQVFSAAAQPSFAAPSSAPNPAVPATAPPPLFAYMYQWFDPNSWNRAKIDYPQLGRYSSDDPKIMREQIQQAQAAGINGFIVSWKNTPTDTRRLRVLTSAAAQQHFALAIIYQGLDFNRHPLPISTVAADFVTFRDQFSGNPVFYRMGGKPLTIWSGTWAYSHTDVAKVTGAVRPAMLVLSTEKNVAGYQRLADVTDGDAYYWSSVDPSHNSGYGTKLKQMAAAVHADGKYWIAPFAPGFDARLVGGKNIVPRNDGATLRIEYSAALQSSPDVLGLISWNEFSENTYVEPSQQFGRRYLDVLTELRNTGAPSPSTAVDSSGTLPGEKSGPDRLNVVLLIGFPFALAMVVGIAAHRRRKRDAPPPPPPTRLSATPEPLIRNGRRS
jgi:hypothetical protein